MNWPDWFGRKAQAEIKKLRAWYADEVIAHGHTIRNLEETNLRLISQLRQMDQDIFSLVQVAPNWAQMQPIVARLKEKVGARMATENDRIRNLMVGEIVTAYNEPSKLRSDYQVEGTVTGRLPKLEKK